MNMSIMKAEIKASAFLAKTLRADMRKKQAYLKTLGASPRTGAKEKVEKSIRDIQARMEENSDQQRHRLLAYGYLRGRTYKEMESKTKTPIGRGRVLTMIGDPKEVDFLRFWFEIGTVPRRHVRAANDQAAEVEKLMNEAAEAGRKLREARNKADNCKNRIEQLKWDLQSNERDLPKLEEKVKEALSKSVAADMALNQGRKRMDDVVKGVAA